jgi:glycosyltransferase involved in cell wall biosynthesis
MKGIASEKRAKQPARVLHLITHFAVGGATEVVLNLCHHANPQRFAMTVLAGRTGDKEQNWVAEAQARGVKVTTLPRLRRSLHPLWDFGAYRALVGWLRENPQEIVHTNGSKAGILGRLAAAKAGVPVILHTVHGWGHHAYMRPAQRAFYIALERRAARVTTRLITVCHANREKGLRDGIGKPEQYTVVYNGIDVPRFQQAGMEAGKLRLSLGIAEDAPVVGTVGRLAPQKAPEDFLKVADRVRRRCPNAKFLYVGGGPQQAWFTAEIRRLGLEPTVLPLGYRRDVPELMHLFDVFLLTSLWEGLPLVIQQAMCAGRPCVATAVDGTPEVVIEGETGYLAAPRDVETLTQRVTELLCSEETRRRMGQAARARAVPRFGLPAMARRMEELYEACLATVMPSERWEPSGME